MIPANTAQTLRSKIIGVLIKDARQVRGLDLAECAAAAGFATETMAAIEGGQTSPALPELEILAYALENAFNRIRKTGEYAPEMPSDARYRKERRQARKIGRLMP